MMTLIDYSYVIHGEYKDLEDGTPNFHHNPSTKVSGRTTMRMLLKVLRSNSKNGQFISNLNFEEVKE